MAVIGQLTEAEKLWREQCLAEDKPHPLVTIYQNGSDMEKDVVRWCPVCGSIVVDVEVDNRTSPGAIMAMRRCRLTDEKANSLSRT